MAPAAIEAESSGAAMRAAGELPVLPRNVATAMSMATWNLGKTGYKVGIFSLGGQAALEQPKNEEVAVAIVERAIDLGINYIDTAAQYGREGRWSQKNIGQVMKRRRKEVYLASKTHDRTRDGSLRLLEESLKSLNTDQLDAWQLHHVSSQADVDDLREGVERLRRCNRRKSRRWCDLRVSRGTRSRAC